MSKKSVKRFWFVLMVVAVAVFQVSAFVIFTAIAISRTSDVMQIEDVNGEDHKSLAVITKDDICSGEYSYGMYNSHVVRKGTNDSGVEGDCGDQDNKYSSLTVERFSGIYVENACLGDGGFVEYTIVSTVTQGNFGIFIVDEELRILQTVDIDKPDTVKFLTEKGKMYYVIYAGESAEIEVQLWRTMG